MVMDAAGVSPVSEFPPLKKETTTPKAGFAIKPWSIKKLTAYKANNVFYYNALTMSIKILL